MEMKINGLHPAFVGEVADVDLREPLDAAGRAAIERGMDKYAVLVFRDQELSKEDQVAFAKQFGPLDVGFKRMKKNQPDRMNSMEVADISNIADAGGVADRSDKKIVSNIANRLWHSDSSFQSPSARYSMLFALQVAEKGGQTEFADLRAACDALPEDLRQEIKDLEAEHYALHSRFLLGDTDYTPEQKQAIPAASWPLLSRHPGSGREVLFVSSHAHSIRGLSLPESRMLLMDLLEHATQREFVYSHEWRPGDLVIWDNRCTLHRGRRFDMSQPREMRRVTTLNVDEPAVAAG